MPSFLNCVSDDNFRHYDVDDYQSGVTKWCSGCGDIGAFNAMKKLLANKQLQPDNLVFVSGIGCSSRFPHYVNAYGFHGIHGRALTIASGVKLTRPELDVFVVMGDGDCCSIGAGHWMHAIRYNMNMLVLLLDNNIYGLTKKQVSPTTPQGFGTNTTPRGAFLPPLNPLTVTLGVTNASFVAQTADWVPAHLYATLEAAYEHKGFSFVRVLQRCPKFTSDVFLDAVKNPDHTEILVHENGIDPPGLEKLYKNRVVHDPSDLDGGRHYAEAGKNVRLGLFYQDRNRPRYEETRAVPVCTAERKIELLNVELDRYAV